MALYCSGYHYCTTSLNKSSTQDLPTVKYYSQLIPGLQWSESPIMATAGNKRPNALCWSMILLKQFIIIIVIITIIVIIYVYICLYKSLKMNFFKKVYFRKFTIPLSDSMKIKSFKN